MVQQQVETSKDFEIVYDRSERIYSVTRQGDVLATFPAKQKGEAQRFVIGMFHPLLAAMANRIAERNPQLERVAWAGARLVAEGAVVEMNEVPVNGCVAMVDSSDGMGRYALMRKPVDAENETVTCNCEHFTSELAPTYTGQTGEHRMCKHIAAYRMVQRLQGAAA